MSLRYIPLVAVVIALSCAVAPTRSVTQLKLDGTPANATVQFMQYIDFYFTLDQNTYGDVSIVTTVTNGLARMVYSAVGQGYYPTSSKSDWDGGLAMSGLPTKFTVGNCFPTIDYGLSTYGEALGGTNISVAATLTKRAPNWPITLEMNDQPWTAKVTGEQYTDFNLTMPWNGNLTIEAYALSGTTENKPLWLEVSLGGAMPRNGQYDFRNSTASFGDAPLKQWFGLELDFLRKGQLVGIALTAQVASEYYVRVRNSTSPTPTKW